jgi:phosphatidylserine/phosphatidylglycerophosphate/cardiolipin synthase-like enzyme
MSTIAVQSTGHGFGVPIGDPLPKPDIQMRVNCIASLAIAALILGAAFGGLLGLAIAGGVVVAIFAGFGVHALIGEIYAHRYDITTSLPLGRASGCGVSYPTALRVIDHVTASFEWKKELISSAESSIELSPNYAGGVQFRETLQLIAARMREKSELRTHILLSADLLEASDKRLLQSLEDEFKGRFIYVITEVVVSSEPIRHAEENHIKLLVVDEKYFVMGGSGIGPKMTREVYQPDQEEAADESFKASLLDKAFRDMDLVGEGQIARVMRQQFYALFSKWENRMHDGKIDRFFDLGGAPRGTSRLFHEKEGLFHDVSAKFIVAGPEHRLANPITSEIARRVTAAQKEIRLTSMVLDPAQPIREALKNKEKKVTVLAYTDGKGHAFSLCRWLHRSASRLNRRLFSYVYEYGGNDQLYHRKVATFDGQVAILGSYNLSFKSDYANDECVLVVDNAKVVDVINSSLDEDAKKSRRYERKDSRRVTDILVGQFVKRCLRRYTT